MRFWEDSFPAPEAAGLPRLGRPADPAGREFPGGHLRKILAHGHGRRLIRSLTWGGTPTPAGTNSRQGVSGSIPAHVSHLVSQCLTFRVVRPAEPGWHELSGVHLRPMGIGLEGG
jgi:hypothetical protein